MARVRSRTPCVDPPHTFPFVVALKEVMHAGGAVFLLVLQE